MPPSILDMNGGQNSVTLTNGNGVSFINTSIPTSCVSPVDPATRTARLQFKLSEPGSGFECQRKDANDADDGAQWATQPEDDADWTECTALNLIAGDNNTRGIVYRPGSLPDAVPAQGYPQGSYIRVEFRNLPEAHYEMAIRAIDPAGNVGPASVAYLSWYIDETRPSTTNLNPDRVIVGEPGPGIQGSLWGAGDRVPGSWNVPYVQCDQTGTPTFTVSSSSGWLNEGCIWRLTNSPQGSQIAVSDSNGSCSVTLNPPAGSCFQNGSYTLAVDYFDVCGDGAGSQSITWMVDRSDINSATITSGTFDNGMANFNLSASGPQMISWEMQGTLGLITAGGPAALISGVSLGYPTGSCTGPGSACAVAYGACGSVKRASGNYQVRGGRGHVCTGIDCSAGNTCSRNISSGTCVDPDACDAPGGVFCTTDNQCGNDWGNGGYSAYCDGHEEYLGGCGCGSPGNDSCCAAGAAGDGCRLSATRTCTTDANCHSSLQCHGYSAEDPGRCHCQENRGPSGFGPAQPVCPNFTGACATAPGDRGGLAPQCGGGGGGGSGCADTVSNACAGNPGQSELCIDYDCNGSATDAGECSGCAGPPGPAPTPPCVRYGCASWFDGTACPGAHAPPGWKCDEYSGCVGQPGYNRICYP
ncbi:MAG: hypothetical protein IT289_08110 [Oligoflexia bacterium]|nr:hypothetical protein [Oligoflexia bacterium]